LLTISVDFPGIKYENFLQVFLASSMKRTGTKYEKFTKIFTNHSAKLFFPLGEELT